MEIIILFLGILAGGVSAYFIVRFKTQKNVIDSSNEDSVNSNEKNETSADVDKQALVIESRAKAKEIIIDARDKSLKIKQEAENEASSVKKQAQQEALKMKEDLEKKEKEVVSKEAELKVKAQELDQRLGEVKKQQEKTEAKLELAQTLVKQKQEDLEKISSLTKKEAREELLKLFDNDLAEEKSKRIRQVEEDIKRESDEIAKEIIIDAMRFGATDYVVANTTSRVKLPDEEMKGRIIGKEGRNIKKFEEITGVDLDLDSYPGEILISSFDSVRREIAKVTLEKLISDGRIQPTRIEEIYEKTVSEINQIMYKEGDNLCHRIGAYNVPKELIQMLGKFKYRYSYGQNMIEHTLEETRIGVAIAKELKLDVETVKLGCLFHDIGKIVEDDEGTHVELGVKLLKKHKIPEAVVNAVAEHHEDRPFSSFESAAVALADHISGARPGARSEDYQSYVERLQKLEEAAMSFDGVEKVYAISAGRDVRVFVSPEKVDDDSTALLAREIAKKIELEQTYPGNVKVTVIRELRVSDIAK